MGEPITIGPARSGGNRRVLVIAGVAAVLLLGLLVLPGMLFGGGGSTAFDDTFPPAGPTTTSAPPGPGPAETFEPFTSKNPFTPLVDTGATAGATDEVGEATTETVTTVDTTGEVFFPDEGAFPSEGGAVPSGEGAGEPSGSTPTTVAPPPPRQPDRVSLLEVYTDPGGQVVASVRVNDATHQVTEGDEFATSYRVLDLDIGTRCGQFLFGDDRFGLCEGEETRK